jgi:hypothetical protein
MVMQTPCISVIHCIGDSHCSFFIGADRIQPYWPADSINELPWFKSYHIGPALAHNLTKNGTTSRGREILFEILSTRVPKGAYVLLSFGEIDCRVHLVKQAHKKGVPLETVVEACLDEYFKVVSEVTAMGYRVIVYNVCPARKGTKFRSLDYKNAEIELVALGSWKDRNLATSLFNTGAKRRCQESGVKFLMNAHHIVNPKGQLIPLFLMDAVHLSQRAMPATLKELRLICPEIKIPPQTIIQPTQLEIWTHYMRGRIIRGFKEIKKIPRWFGIK